MKLTGDLKNQVEKAESKDEKKSLIENAGMELTDDELNMVAGGTVIETLDPFIKDDSDGCPDFQLPPVYRHTPGHP